MYNSERTMGLFTVHYFDFNDNELDDVLKIIEEGFNEGYNSIPFAELHIDEEVSSLELKVSITKKEEL